MKKILIGVFGGLILGAGVGYGVGDYKGYHRSMVNMINECAYGDTLEADVHLNALKDLRTGKTKEGMETIEARLDNLLILFDPVTPYPFTEGTNAKVNKTIQDAKQYRTKYPRKSKTGMMDKMVQHSLNRGIQ